MPYKKEKFSGISELLASRKMTPAKLAKIIGCSESTAWRRLNDIGELKVRELADVMRAAHISKDELRGKI